MHDSFLLTGGIFTWFGYPGVSDTYAFDINNADQIIGLYYAYDAPNYGFLATPIVPVPAAIFLFGPGIAGIVLLRRNSRLAYPCHIATADQVCAAARLSATSGAGIR